MDFKESKNFKLIFPLRVYGIHDVDVLKSPVQSTTISFRLFLLAETRKEKLNTKEFESIVAR